MNNQGTNNVHQLVLTILAIFIIFLAIGVFAKPYLLYIGKLATKHSLVMLYWLLSSGEFGKGVAQIFVPGIDENQFNAIIQSFERDALDLNFYLSFVGQMSRPVFMFVATICALSIWRLHRPGRMKRQFGIDKLAAHAVAFNPALRPVLAADLLNQDPDKGQLRRDDSPIREAIIHGLIKVYERDQFGDLNLDKLLTPTFDPVLGKRDGFVFVHDDLDKGISQLHRSCVLEMPAIEKYFTYQLGEAVSSIHGFSLIEQTFLAICLPMMHQDKATTFELINELNLAFDVKQAKKQRCDWIPTQKVNQIIDKYKNGSELYHRLFTQHGFATTVLTDALLLARAKGKLPTDTLMYWIKWYDRKLWYTINMVGCPAAWMSVSAIRSTYLMEKKLSRKLHQPFIATSVSAFIEFMDETEGWIYEHIDGDNSWQ